METCMYKYNDKHFKEIYNTFFKYQFILLQYKHFPNIVF